MFSLAGFMRYDMLERDRQLALLKAAHAQVLQGPAGVCVTLSGEAGIGKTTLVQAFVQTLTPNAQVLLSGCEALFTPRPFGPLVDLADRFPPSVARALQQGQTYNGLFPELLRFFKESARPNVFVVEDAHWADSGTLDLLRYIGRRLRDVRLLMLLTHRDEALADAHPLSIVLGDLPPATTLRMALPPLTLAAVSEMARAAQRDSAEVYAATGGNPFYVTEVLAGQDQRIPPSVRDAVRSALARLPPDARTLAEWVSLFPGRAERRLLDPVAAAEPSAVEACLSCGLLHAGGDALSFRHEIARTAVYETMPAHRRFEGHRTIYRALFADPDEQAAPARLVHHAEAGGLHDELAALAPRAARQAAYTGAHREAARLYGIALRHSQRLDGAAHADLLEAYAHECMLTNQHGAALAAREQAHELRVAAGDTLRAGINLRWLARVHWLQNGSNPTTRRIAQQAIDTLMAVQPPHRELALAYSSMSHLHLLGEDMQAAQLWGLRAVELAETLDDAEAMSHALNNVGTAALRLRDDGAAWGRLARSLALALEHGLEQDAARAYNNLFILCVVHHDFALGLRTAEAGIAYCEAKGLDIFTVRIRIRRAFAHIMMGRWELADQDLSEVAQRHTPSAMEAATHRFVAHLLALRRGTPGAAAQIAATTAALRAARVEIWFISMAATLAEAAWLEGRSADILPLVAPTLRLMASLGDRWRAGELASWLVRAGGRIEGTLPDLPRPYALELRGDWRKAAESWKQLGCPYDRALALCAGDEAGLREALAIFAALGAASAAERVRQLLRERGASGVPRGPQPRTRDDPLGLTAREREVFELARDGLPGAEIARRLHRSERTVEHHLAAVYRKLGVGTRAELMARHPGAAPPSTAKK